MNRNMDALGLLGHLADAADITELGISKSLSAQITYQQQKNSLRKKVQPSPP